MKTNEFKSIWVSNVTALRLGEMANAMKRKNLERGIKCKVTQSEIADRLLSNALKKELVKLK